MRGNEKKDIFLDNEDREKFIDILYNKKELSKYTLYAYCLMSNHVHILIKEDVETLSQCIKRINTSYAYYFNKKYQRIGHFFQDRYKSECVDSESYLLSAMRYIHNNPVNAGIVDRPGDYMWSSYNIYSGILKDKYLIDKTEILSLFSNNIKKAQLSFLSFSNRMSDDSGFIDFPESGSKHITIRGIGDAKKYIHDFLQEHSVEPEEINYKDNTDYRNKLISHLKMYSNLSIRDISQILNVNRGTVARISM